MKCALAAVGFINEDSIHNKNVIIGIMKQYAGKADVVIFGEAFLQGFYGLNFQVEHDEKIAVSKDNDIIREICNVAKEYKIGVSFGFIEREGDIFYSSQITVAADGTILDIYRRVSPGWKEEFANEQYREGDGFHTFVYEGKSIAVGLCGDLWFDENVAAIKELQADVVFWPVYTDFNSEEWNTEVKYEYAEQGGGIGSKVLYVNSVCLDKEGEEIAKGGAAIFVEGKIEAEIPSGDEGVLIVEV